MNKLYSFNVKYATEDDIPAISKITKEAFLRYCDLAQIPPNVDALRETYEDIQSDIENKTVFVAFIDGEPVGSVRVGMIDEKTAYLSRFGVDENHRNSGIGKILLNVVDNLMRENNVEKLMLHTSSAALSLVRFYYGRGFYISSVEYSRGYPRAELVKYYKNRGD